MSARSLAAVTADVAAFYNELPFNLHGRSEDDAVSLSQSNQVAHYPALESILEKVETAIDLGCGAGWFANSLAHYYGLQVWGVDLSQSAIDRAIDVARLLELSSQFRCQNLFEIDSSETYDLVNSLGALHHTGDLVRAVGIASDLVSTGGYLHIGLYHTHGRAPFLQYFHNLQSSGASDDELRERYAELHSSSDATFQESWFRDQVLHPFECQTTLRELNDWLPADFSLLSTSINCFKPLPENYDELWALEADMKAVGEQALKEKRYYPGFFVALYRRGEMT